jgi:acetoin utilization deacetylase AcuC-like enzyme
MTVISIGDRTLRTAFISHHKCRGHDTGPGHPETARRLTAIDDRFVATGLSDVLSHVDAPVVTTEQLQRVHRPDYLEFLQRMIPAEGYARLDPDTVVSQGSLLAARLAAGAAVAAVDLVAGGAMRTAFCSVRPPGHHAESDLAMGFCLYNNVAVGAAHALEAHGLERIAILDFDVHHGNGTEQIFDGDPRVLFCSTFQHPFFPFTPLRENTPNRISVPLEAGSGSKRFRTAVSEQWLPAVERFRPQMVFVSAGFDAHRDDDMAELNLTDADFHWVSRQILQAAADSAEGRIVSVLEGGYDIDSLARCVEDHVRVIAGLR